MKAIKEYKPELEGVLPKNEYAALTRTDKTIPQQLLRTFADIPADATGDLRVSTTARQLEEAISKNIKAVAGEA